MSGFVSGLVIGAMGAILVCGIIMAVTDYWMKRAKDCSEYVKDVNLVAECSRLAIENSRLEKQVREIATQKKVLERELDRVRLENARLREVDVDE